MARLERAGALKHRSRPVQGRLGCELLPGDTLANYTEHSGGWQSAWLPGPILRKHFFRDEPQIAAFALGEADAGVCRTAWKDYRLVDDTADREAVQ